MPPPPASRPSEILRHTSISLEDGNRYTEVMLDASKTDTSTGYYIFGVVLFRSLPRPSPGREGAWRQPRSAKFGLSMRRESLTHPNVIVKDVIVCGRGGGCDSYLAGTYNIHGLLLTFGFPPRPRQEQCSIPRVQLASTYFSMCRPSNNNRAH